MKNQVSIPAWCDWERLYKYIRISNAKVSIPAWCDWETVTGFGRQFIFRFNSSLVRLGESHWNSGVGKKFVSIPAWCDWELVLLLQLLNLLKCFNSSLVRLGVLWCQVTEKSFPSFNSSLVRLGGWMRRRFFKKKMCFNSSLVRLGGN